jgi:hypothetical protein
VTNSIALARIRDFLKTLRAFSTDSRIIVLSLSVETTFSIVQGASQAPAPRPRTWLSPGNSGASLVLTATSSTENHQSSRRRDSRSTLSFSFRSKRPFRAFQQAPRVSNHRPGGSAARRELPSILKATEQHELHALFFIFLETGVIRPKKWRPGRRAAPGQ